MSSSENLAPKVIVRVAKEIRQLSESPPDGIKYIHNEDEILSEIHAEISGPDATPFEGGVFRMKLLLGENYPNVPPKGYFLTRIFHPNVSTNGDICVNTLKKDWTPDLGIAHILQVIRCLLIVPFPESSLNDEAGKLFMDSYEEYDRRARLMTRVHATKTLCNPIDVLQEANSNILQSCDVNKLTSKSQTSIRDRISTKKKGLKRL